MASAHDEQIAYWNGSRGESWVEEQAQRDRALRPFGDAALALARPQAGERVVDIGCGCGDSSLALAAAVGPSGEVLGLDVSAAMLNRARERVAAVHGGVPQLQFAWGDAAAYPFDGDAQLLFSRFGVMFFGEPLAAFAHLRQALAPGGRLAFVCWRQLGENAWMNLPYQAVLAALPRPPPPTTVDGPGPLALADAERVQSLLASAGFGQVVLRPFDGVMPLGAGRGLEAAVQEALTVGPLGRLLFDADPEQLTAAAAAVRAALRPALAGDSVALPAAAWLVTARSG